MTARHNIMRHIEAVTAYCNVNGLATQWTVYPPPAFGGIVRRFNVFEAFIDLNLEEDGRPNLLHITDILNRALLVCERQIKVRAENPPIPVVDSLRMAPYRIGAVFEWFFPSQTQRTILGWLIIGTGILLMLRYIFGLHFEDVGKLVTKWVFK